MKALFSILSLVVLALGSGAEVRAAEKMPAAGIMYLSDDAPGPLQDQPSHFSCPAANGLSFRTAWAIMEPEEGKYDWSKVDTMVAAAAAAHKPMGLGVVAGFRCPPWVMHANIQMITGSLIRSFAPTQTMTMPLPWDPVYQEKWGAFLSALGKRYDGNPNVAYIVMAGMGHAFEPGMARAPADVEKFNSLGGLSSWLSGSEKIVDLYAQAFPHTPFIFAMNRPIPSPDALDTAKMLIDYGIQKYPGRFGLMFDGLDGTETGQPNQIIAADSATTTVGYQMVWSTTGVNAHWLKGSLQDCVEAGVDTKAHFIEVYGSDCDDPQYTAGLQQAGAQLKAIVSGGK